VRAKEIEHRKLDLRGADPRAQIVRRKAGQVEKPPRPALLRQEPGKGAERKRRGVDG
jgi:hypothetical protein